MGLELSDDNSCGGQPTVVVKNTFLNVETPQNNRIDPAYQSCPVAAFSDPVSADDGQALADSSSGIPEIRMCDLAAAAQMFSKCKISRDEMESKGFIAARGDNRGIGEFTAERTWGIDSEESFGVPPHIPAPPPELCPLPTSL